MKVNTILARQDIRHFISESWSNSWPMILIMFFEFLIGLTDIYIAGRIGRDVQASYGFVIQMYFVFIIIANALTAGTVSVISRLFTAGDKNLLNNAIYSVIVTTIVAGILFGIAGIFLTPLLVNFVNIPKELKPFAIPLGKIYAGGLLFHYIVINTNGILRACKQVRVSLKTMSIVCAANIVINFLFLFYTHIGYKGIALSTAISVCHRQHTKSRVHETICKGNEKVFTRKYEDNHKHRLAIRTGPGFLATPFYGNLSDFKRSAAKQY